MSDTKECPATSEPCPIQDKIDGLVASHTEFVRKFDAFMEKWQQMQIARAAEGEQFKGLLSTVTTLQAQFNTLGTKVGDQELTQAKVKGAIIVTNAFWIVASTVALVWAALKEKVKP